MSYGISKLDAVNVGIISAGGTPVSSLESTRPDVQSLSRLIETVSTEIQARGWWFNREYELVLSPDAQGRIIIPQSALAVDAIDTTDEFVPRGKFLYDREKTTFNIGRSVRVDVTTRLAWEDLPYHAQSAIQYQAAMDFVGGDDGDNDEFARLRLKFDTAFAELKRINLRSEDVSVRQNHTVARVMARRNNRVTTRFGGARS